MTLFSRFVVGVLGVAFLFFFMGCEFLHADTTTLAALLKKEKWEEALRLLPPEVRSGGGEIGDWRAAALCYRGLKKYSLAKDFFTKILDRQPDDWMALTGLASVQWSMGEFRGSLELFQRARTLQPHNEKIRARIAELERTLSEDLPKGPQTSAGKGEKPLEARALAFNEQGLKEMGGKNYEAAIEAFNNAIEIAPKNPVLRKNLATAYCFKGDTIGVAEYENAKEWIEKAIEMVPGEFDFRFSRALLEHKQKNFEEAENLFAEAAKYMKKPGDPNFFAWRGKNHEFLGTLEAACECMETALRLKPDYPGLAEILELLRKRMGLQKDMDTQSFGNFKLRFTGSAGKELLVNIGGALQSAYDKIAADLDFSTNQPILVVLYSKQDYKDSTTISWSAANYDGTLNIGVERLTYSLEKTLCHEYVHYAVDRLAGGKCPKWLNEGLAKYESEDWGEREAGFIRKILLNNQVPPWDALSFGHSMTGEEVTPHYTIGYTIAEFLVESYGHSGIQSFFSELKQGQSPDDASQTAFQDNLENLQRTYVGWAKKKYE